MVFLKEGEVGCSAPDLTVEMATGTENSTWKVVQDFSSD